MLIKRNLNANIIIYVYVIGNQAEYQCDFEKFKEQEQNG